MGFLRVGEIVQFQSPWNEVTGASRLPSSNRSRTLMRTIRSVNPAQERGLMGLDENGGGPGVRLRKPVRGKSGK